MKHFISAWILLGACLSVGIASGQYSKQFQVGAGFGHLSPGSFLHLTTPGKAYTYPYLMLNTIL